MRDSVKEAVRVLTEHLEKNPCPESGLMGWRMVLAELRFLDWLRLASEVPVLDAAKFVARLASDDLRPRIGVLYPTEREKRRVLDYMCDASPDIVSIRGSIITFRSGSQVSLIPARDCPQVLCGQQFHYAWIVEPIERYYDDALWETVGFGLRLGNRPFIIRSVIG